MAYKVAILGVGKMGAAIGRELIISGVEIKLWNRNRGSADSLVAECEPSSAAVADSIRDALIDADIAICTFVDGRVTQEVLLSDPNLLQITKKSLIIVDMGTSGVESAKTLEKAVIYEGRRFVDAPVSGSIATIAAHQLLVMASGSPGDVDQIRPVLNVFAKKVDYLGEVGAGQAMKLAVNLIVHGLNAIMSEALALATSAGISPSDAYGVFEESVVAAPFVKYKRSAFLNPHAKADMRMDTVVKDLKLIRALGDSNGVPLHATSAVQNLYEWACNAGFESSDMASLTHHLNVSQFS